MAMVWITKIQNFTQDTFTLRQNDPTYHPVIGGHQFKRDVPIPVPPGTDHDCSYFVIPWANSGRLEVDGPAGKLTFIVGPNGTASGDFLRGFDAQMDPVLEVAMGPPGGNLVASVSLHLVFNATGMHFLVWEANQVGTDILNEAKKELEALAPALLGKLIPGAKP